MMKKLNIIIILIMFLAFSGCHKPSGLFIKIINDTENKINVKIYKSDNNQNYSILDSASDGFMINEKSEETIFIRPASSKFYGIQIYGCNNETITIQQEKIYSYTSGHQSETLIIEKKCENINPDCLETQLESFSPYCGTSSGDGDADGDSDIINDIIDDSESDNIYFDTKFDSDINYLPDNNETAKNFGNICIDLDGDNYGTDCDSGDDCDDSTPLCNVDCSDNNNNSIYDCKENCNDNDNDGYGNGSGCFGLDCDANNPYCNIDCIDNDGDQHCINNDCNDEDPNNWESCLYCNDYDNDAFYNYCDRYETITGPDCNDNIFVCNRDCSDRNSDGIEDCNYCIDSPHEIGSLYSDSDYYINDVFVDDNYYAYLSAGINGLKIVDIFDIETPVETGSYNASEYSSRIQLLDNLAFIVDSYGLRIINVSNVFVPEEIVSYSLNNSIGFDISGNYAYITYNNGVNSAGLKIIDITNIGRLHEVGSYETDGDIQKGLYISGNYAFIADGEMGLKIIDISNPASPQETSSLQTSGEASGIYVDGNYSYISEGSGILRIIDINDINNPHEVGYYNPNSFTFSFSFGLPSDVEVRGNKAFITDSDGLRIIDISNVSDPVEIGYYDSLAICNNLFVDDANHIFLACGYNGFKIISLLCEEQQFN